MIKKKAKRYERHHGGGYARSLTILFYFFFHSIRTATGVDVRKAIIVFRDNELDPPEINAIDSMAVYWPKLFLRLTYRKNAIVRVGYDAVNTIFMNDEFVVHVILAQRTTTRNIVTFFDAISETGTFECARITDGVR